MNGLFVINLILAVSWAGLSGEFTLRSLLTGLAIGFGALWVASPLFPDRGGGYFLRAWHWVRLIVMFHYELIVSSIAVAWDVLTPRQTARPSIVAVPLSVRTDAGILLVTNLISLTPGTLSLDVTEDCSTLYVHAMFSDDPERLRAEIRDGMERWVREAVE
jgi:multicomponent Na+:H+ antiporter subunit E